MSGKVGTSGIKSLQSNCLQARLGTKYFNSLTTWKIDTWVQLLYREAGERFLALEFARSC